MNLSPSDVKALAIKGNLRALQVLLEAAARRSTEACVHSLNGERKEAIAAVAGLDEVLDDAKSLYGAVMTIHGLKAI